MAENIMDCQTMLAYMEARKAAWEQAIASLKAAIAVDTLGEVSVGSFSTVSPSMEPVELPRGAFLNKSLPAAIKLYLASVKKKQTAQQIATALKDGGMESMATNFDTVVVGALHRLKAKKEVLRFKDGWGLAVQYPEHIRKAISEDNKPSRKKTKKAKSTAQRQPKAKAQVVPIGQGLEQRIAGILTAEKVSATEVATALGVNVNGVSLALGRMAAKHKAEKCGDGKYRAPNEKVQKAV